MGVLYPDAVNFTGFPDMFNYMNVVTGGWGTLMMIIGLMVIMFAYLIRKGRDVKDSLIATVYVNIIFVGLFYVIDMVSLTFVLVYGLFAGIAMLLWFVMRD